MQERVESVDVSARILARAQITATWYDTLDRPIHTAQYGTFGLNESSGPSSFSHPGSGSPPTRSNSVLVTSTTYDTDGTVLEVEAPGKPSAPTGTAGTKTRSTQANNPVYNKGGQLTDDGKTYKHVYDAFGRLVKLTDRGTTPSTKAEYRYNGLGQRAAYKLNGTGTWYDLVQDEQWREVAVVDRTNSKLLERTLYHNAGLNGRGGSSYIDSCAIRETNPTTGTYPVMQTRWYTLQNWRADVVATLASNGTLSAWSSYTAYGKQNIWRVTDVDDGSGNGVPDEGVTTDDLLLYLAWFEAGDPRADVDDGNGKGALDAGVTIDDLLFYMAYYEGSTGDFNSRLGYAGYVKDEADSGQSGLYHVRYRVYSTDLGSWLTQDPLGYVDGISLYEYAASRIVCCTDPAGLCASGPETTEDRTPEQIKADICAAIRLMKDQNKSLKDWVAIYSPTWGTSQNAFHKVEISIRNGDPIIDLDWMLTIVYFHYHGIPTAEESKTNLLKGRDAIHIYTIAKPLWMLKQSIWNLSFKYLSLSRLANPAEVEAMRFAQQLIDGTTTIDQLFAQYCGNTSNAPKQDWQKLVESVNW